MKRKTGLGLLLLLASLPLFAKPTLVREVEGVFEYKLDNGLQILLLPDNAKPVTLVNMTYKVGSRHENYGETGMAHLLEHLIFKGSPKTPEPWAEFTRRGLQANGTTNPDRTNYFASFAANDDTLKWYLGWQADAMVNSHIAKKDLDSEMTVVRNEMERGENNPGRVLYQTMLQSMFGWHNYGKSTIGARSDVENVDIGRLKGFYQTYYRPDNAALIITGKFDTQKVLGWIDDSFGKLAAGKAPLPRLYTIEAAQDGERNITVRRVGGTPIVMAGYRIPPAASREYAALWLLGEILNDVPSGRLYQALVEKQKLATGAGFGARAMHDPGMASLSASPTEKADLDVLQREMLAIAEGFAAKPVTAAELERARKVWLNGWEKRFASPEAVGQGLSEAVAVGDWRLTFLLRDRIKTLTVEEVQQAAVKYLQASNRTVARYIPTDKPQRAPAPAFADIAKELQDFKPQAAAKAVAEFEATPANIDAHTIKGQIGTLKYALLPKPTRGEIVTGTLTLDMGSEQSLQNQVQVASFLRNMLGQGTARLSRQQFNDAADAAKLSWRVSGGAAGISVSFSTVRSQLDASLALLSEALRQPRLDAAALEEERNQALDSLKKQRDEPGSVAANAVAKALNHYPKGSVFYARSPDEREADIRAVTLAQVQDFHRRFYGTQQARFTLVGDFDAKAVPAQLDKLLTGWSAPEAVVKFDYQPAFKPGQRLQLRTPDKANANVSGTLELPIGNDHADVPALNVALHILGDSGNSRLWKRIREKDGLSYGVGMFADLSADEPNGELGIHGSFAPQNLARFEQALQEEMQRALKDGFSAAELAAAKQTIAREIEMDLAQDSSLAGRLSGNLKRNRDLAYTASRLQQYQALTLDEVNAALRRYLKPENFVIAYAGDFK